MAVGRQGISMEGMIWECMRDDGGSGGDRMAMGTGVTSMERLLQSSERADRTVCDKRKSLTLHVQRWVHTGSRIAL